MATLRDSTADERAAMNSPALNVQADQLEQEYAALLSQSRSLLQTVKSGTGVSDESNDLVRDAVTALFDAQHNLQQARLRLMEARLAEVRAALTQREQNRDQLIQELTAQIRDAGATHPLLNP
ncbi:MAG: hypothetical protein KDA85_08100, partial [Planctomycetaceae bacterium]|nr:hypothetical protein [Planctomycetaceae bacterium]